MSPGCFAGSDLTTDILLPGQSLLGRTPEGRIGIVLLSEQNREDMWRSSIHSKGFDLPRLAIHFCSLRPNYPSSQRLRETAQARVAATLPPMGVSFVSNEWGNLEGHHRAVDEGLLAVQNLEISTPGVSNITGFGKSQQFGLGLQSKLSANIIIDNYSL